jgi:hypothetical protein
MIDSVVHAAGMSSKAISADDFLPIFILVVLRSRAPRLVTNCEYIQHYHNPADMLSRQVCSNM